MFSGGMVVRFVLYDLRMNPKVLYRLLALKGVEGSIITIPVFLPGGLTAVQGSE